MRFFLDQNVDHEVGIMLRQQGHDAWTASDAGLFDAGDDVLTVYAQDRGAALMTHDKAFSQRRRRNTIGRHVWVHCLPPDAVEVIAARLTELVGALSVHENCYAQLTRDRLTISMRWD